MELREKVVIITGASAGIGLATAQLFAQHGAKVALAARSADKLNQLAAHLKDSFAVVVDMSREAEVKQMIAAVHAHYGRIDMLINNAGQGMGSPVAQVNLDQYRALMELNVFGPVAAMQAVIPIMRQQGSGVIVNISSGVSKMYIPGLAAYASTKYALNAITLTARTELAEDNIRVGVVYPGLTATEFGKNAVGSGHAPRRPPAQTNGGGQNGPSIETAEQVAEKILEAVQTEAAEVFTNNTLMLRTPR